MGDDTASWRRFIGGLGGTFQASRVGGRGFDERLQWANPTGRNYLRRQFLGFSSKHLPFQNDVIHAGCVFRGVVKP